MISGISSICSEACVTIALQRTSNGPLSEFCSRLRRYNLSKSISLDRIMSLVLGRVGGRQLYSTFVRQPPDP